MAAFFCIIAWCNLASADVIKNYHVDITVLESGKIDVVETIDLDTEHDTFRLGLVREIPRQYRLLSQKITTPITVLSVTRDGKPENYWREISADLFEIFTGEKENRSENYIPKGLNQYQIHWQSDNHLRSFRDYDELYFNAIGHDWQVPIQNASATVHLPNTVEIMQTAGYFGRYGDQERALVEKINDHTVRFVVPSELKRKEGLTVAVGYTPNVLPSVKSSNYEHLIYELSDQINLPYITPWMLEWGVIQLGFFCMF